MATPTAKSYSAASGGTIAGGRSISPAWALAIGVGQIKTISGTAGAGGSDVDFYCGWAFNSFSNEIVNSADGGHYDSYDNRVTSIDLTQDAPTWQLRIAPSLQAAAGPPYDQAYYTDGKPSARHTYSWLHWVPQTGRYMLVGNYGAYGGPGGGGSGTGSANNNVMDGFDPATNTWDAAGTWPWPASSDGYWGNAKEGPNGDIVAIWGSAGQRIYRVALNTWITPTVTNQQAVTMRNPWAYNTTDGYLFGLMIGDGQGGGSGVRAVKQVRTGTTTVTQTAITFNSSAAYTQFVADGGIYAGMDFNPRDGCFYWYSGSGSAFAGRIYKITPNAGTAWDMEIVTPAAGSVTVPTTSNGGINSKFSFVTLPGGIEGFVFLPSKASALHFLRTA